jgi:hypothetical protein
MDEKQLQEVARIFDSIISSPSQAVQEAFRNLTVLATLSRSEDVNTPGPFEKIFDRLGSLEYEVKELRREVQIHNNDFDIKGIDGLQVIDLSDVNMNTTYFSNIGPITLTGASGADSYTWESSDVIQVSGLDNIDIKIK